MGVDRLVLTLSEVEQAGILVVSAAVVPAVHVTGHVFVSRHLNAVVPLTTDNHEHVLQIFCQNGLVLVALEEPVKIVHLTLLLNRQFLPKESHLVHDVGHEVELEGVLLRINITLNRHLTGLDELLILQLEEDAAELLLEALNTILFALLQVELRVGTHVNFLLVLQLGLLLREHTLRVQVVQLVDAARRVSGCGTLGSTHGTPILVDLVCRRRLLFVLLLGTLADLSQLLLALGVQTLVNGSALAVFHGLHDLLRQVVDGRLGLQLLQLILNRILLRFQLFHAAVFKETLLIAQETVEVAHFLAVAVEHSTARLKSVRSKRASFDFLFRFGLTCVLEVLFADLAEDVFAQHVLLVTRTAMLG